MILNYFRIPYLSSVIVTHTFIAYYIHYFLWQVMWILRYLESDNTFKEAPLRLIASDAIKVGRKDDADLVLKGDKAISRAHAVFTVEELPYNELGNIHSRQVIKVMDLGSKFGTKVRKVGFHQC